MLTGRLPDTADYRQLAAEGGRLAGSLELARMSRLVPMLSSDDGALAAEVEIRHRKRGRYLIVARASGSVRVGCSRCLDPVDVALDVRVRLWIVSSEADLLALEVDDDGLVVEGGRIVLADIFEDELILSLPMSAVHDDACSPADVVVVPEASVDEVVASGSTEVDVPTTHRPFAGLATLLDPVRGAGDSPDSKK